jgi:hypothetical protein
VTRAARALAATLFVACAPPAPTDAPSSDGSAERYDPAPPEARRADLVVGPDFAGAELRGFAGGPVRGAALGDECPGQYPLQPQHVIELEQPAALTLRAEPQGVGFMDLVLALRGPDGEVRCVDDSDSLDPELGALLEAGRWAVLVGAIPMETPPYLLRVTPGISTRTPVGVGDAFPAPPLDGPAPEPVDAGSSGGLRVSAGTAPGTLEGVAGGTAPAVDLGPECRGFVAPAPDHLIEVLATETLTLRVTSEADTTLAVVGPGGRVWCRDDEIGLDPALRETLEPGTYAVFVGAFSQTDAPGYSLRVSR